MRANKFSPLGSRKVWRALTTIPFGETRSYRQIAVQIGHPDAVRAVSYLCFQMALLSPLVRHQRFVVNQAAEGGVGVCQFRISGDHLIR